MTTLKIPQEYTTGELLASVCTSVCDGVWGIWKAQLPDMVQEEPGAPVSPGWGVPMDIINKSSSKKKGLKQTFDLGSE